MKITKKVIVRAVVQLVMGALALGAIIPIVCGIVFFYLYIYMWLDGYGIILTRFATDAIMYGTMCLMLILIIVFVGITIKLGNEIIKMIFEEKNEESEKDGTTTKNRG